MCVLKVPAVSIPVLRRSTIFARQPVAITADDVKRLSIRPRHDGMQTMLHPIRCIARHARKLNELLRRVQLVVGVGIFDSQQYIGPETRFRMITVLHHIQCAMQKRHAL